MALSTITVSGSQIDYTDEFTDTNIPRRNGQTVSTAFTIDSDQNAMCAGPVTQNATVTVNGYWSIV